LKKFSFLTAGLLLALFQPATALSAPNWTVYYNIKYGVTDQETADLYLLNKGVNPVVVFIHGGAWQAGDKSNYAGFDAEMFPWQDLMWSRSIIASRIMLIAPRSGTNSCRMCS
jgi:acetyl esterase/lipase